MGNKSGKQKVTKKGKNDEQPNENKAEDKPENGPTTTTEKAEDKTVDQAADDSGKDGKDGDGGGGGATEDVEDKKPETEKTDNAGDEAAKDVPKESDYTDKEQTGDQQGDSSVVPKETEPSDNSVKDNIETETPQPSDSVTDKIANETPSPDSSSDKKDEPAGEIVVDDSKDKVEETPVINGDHEAEIPSTDGDDTVGDKAVEPTKEEVVPNGEPSKDVQIEVTPPVPNETETNGTEDDKPETTDQDLEKQDEPPTEHPPELTETKYEVEFKWEEAGENVLVSGTFNEWKEKIPLEKSDDVFTAKMELPAGEYLYKYFVDDQWVINKNQPIKQDEEGTDNNVLVVESAG